MANKETQQSFQSYMAEQILKKASLENAGTEFYPLVKEQAEKAIIAAGGKVEVRDDLTAVTFPIGTIEYGDTVELPTGVKLREGEESLYRPE